MSESKQTEMNTSKSRPVAVITGFGLFGNYNVNPSWEAVNLLESTKVNLIKKKVDVIYETVDKVIPQIWEEHRPDLVLHVGVSYMATGIVLERCAHSFGYNRLDVNRCTAHCEKAILADGCAECLNTEVDVEDLCGHLKRLYQSGKLKLDATTSIDAGRFLCEYIYYNSLKCLELKKTSSSSPCLCLFVHVPEINEKLGFTVETIREELQEILDYLIERI